MNEYKGFSYYFDQIMELIDYNDWVNFTKKYVETNSKILDLACGSGTLALLLAVEGYNVDGLDLSSDMISLANDKFKANHIHSNLYVMDMSNFNLNKHYDAITCYFDSINHLPSLDLVKNMMESVARHLNKGGFFIFDVFSKSKYHEMNKLNLKENFEDFSYRWKIKTKKPNILSHKITIKNENENISEKYNEYYYDINDFIDESKFEILNVAGDFKDTLSEDDERILVVLKKK